MSLSYPALEGIRLEDPGFYEDPWTAYAALRRDAPVFWHEPTACWVISKYQDIQRLCSDDEAFSTGYGATLGPQLGALRCVPYTQNSAQRIERLVAARNTLARQASASRDAEHLLRVDPPRHGRIRRLVKSRFTPRSVADFEPVIREIVTQALDAFEGEDVIDLVEAISMPVPLFVIASLLGIPSTDRGLFKTWTDTVMRFNDGLGDASAHEVSELKATLEAMYAYFYRRLAAAVEHGDDDLLAQLVRGRIDGEPLSMPSMQTLCRVLLVGGNETTRHLISGAALALAEHPDQRELLTRDLELLPTAIEEFLRWITPARHICRTARIRTEIRGQVIQPGDYLIGLLASANRDEEIWPDANVFDVTRPVAPKHMSFAYGTHMCLGQHFPRLETRIVFEEFLRRYPSYELAGPAVRGRLLVLNGIESLPIRLRPAG